MKGETRRAISPRIIESGLDEKMLVGVAGGFHARNLAISIRHHRKDYLIIVMVGSRITFLYVRDTLRLRIHLHPILTDMDGVFFGDFDKHPITHLSGFTPFVAKLHQKRAEVVFSLPIANVSSPVTVTPVIPLHDLLIADGHQTFVPARAGGELMP
jgi:hypothetical protein